MDLTYSDMYALLSADYAADQYFQELPEYVQAQIRAKKHQPNSYAALVRMAEDAQKAF